jgi:DNA-binding CsgD family transcriptional regulator
MSNATQQAHGMTGPAPPLVGRAAERVLLNEQLSAVLAGRGNVVIVGGEAGIGKTTIARDLARQARVAGASVLPAFCHDLMAAPPYGLWIDFAERYRQLPDRADLPPLLEALADRTLDRIGTQSALFAEVTEFLRAIAGERPLLLVLEDVHWADPASLELLRYLSSRIGHLPLLVLVTYRVDELTRQNPFYQQLPALVRESEGLRIDLRRLDGAELDALIRAHYELPDGDRERLVAHLAAYAEGNPFFAMELLRTLEEQGDGGLSRVDGGWRLAAIDQLHVPPLVRQVIDARVARLGETVREPLTIASVIGHDVPLDLLTTIAGTDEDALFAALDRAIEWHLCTESPDGSQLHFVHALTREALYASIPPRRRRALHRQVAEALEARPDADPDTIAWHYQQALDPRAPEWLVRAGDRAQRAYAWRTATNRFKAAAHLLGSVPGAEVERGRLLYRCGRLQRYANAPDAIACLRTAARLATDAENRLLAADATYSQGLVHIFADDWTHGLPMVTSGVGALRELPPSETRIGATDAIWMADALPPMETWTSTHPGMAPHALIALDANRTASLAWFLAEAGHLDEALALTGVFRDSIAGTDPGPLVIANLGHAEFGTGIAQAALGNSEAASAAFAASRHAYREIDHHACVAFSLLTELLAVAIPYHADDPAARQRLATEAGREIELARGAFPPDVAPDLAQLAHLALAGDWQRARDIAARTERFGTYVVRRQVTHAIPSIARHSGRPSEAWRHIRWMLPNGPDAEPGSAVLLDALMLQQLAADLCLDAGDLADAERWLRANDRWLDWSGSVLGRSGNALARARWHDVAGDPETAATLADRAVALASDPRQPLALLQAHRFRGELATRHGDRALAASALAAALDLATACELPFERAATLTALAELHAAGTASTAMAEDALDIARGLGAWPLVDRIARVRNGTSAEPIPHPAGLTTREVEVLRLVAGGLTDAEVGDRLSISPRTVGQHLRSVYSKLDVRSRTEATRFAIEHGVV